MPPRRSTSVKTRTSGEPGSGCWPGRRVTRTQQAPSGRSTSRWAPTVPSTAQVRQHGNGRDTRHREGVSVLPRSGEVLCVTRSASAQFTEPIMFRVIRVHDWQTADGWAWLDGYQLDSTGDAVERRSIFVQLTGLRSPGVALR